MHYTLNVNGKERTVAVPAHRTLLNALRDELGLMGAHLCRCGAYPEILTAIRSLAGESR